MDDLLYLNLPMQPNYLHYLQVLQNKFTPITLALKKSTHPPQTASVWCFKHLRVAHQVAAQHENILPLGTQIKMLCTNDITFQNMTPEIFHMMKC